MWQAWINAIAGIWVFLSGFLNAAITPWNFFIMGLIIAVFGFWTYRGQWQGYVNGILGLWLILSSFVSALINPVNLWITGIIVTAMAVWRIISAQRRHPAGGTRL
jgi:hypothetical protein